MAITFVNYILFMSNKRNRAYRRWKTFTKYISRMKERMWWYIEDPDAPRGMRHPKNWKELDKDENNAEVKMLRKTTTRWTSKWSRAEAHLRIKKLREDDRNVIDEELKDIEK